MWCSLLRQIRPFLFELLASHRVQRIAFSNFAPLRADTINQPIVVDATPDGTVWCWKPQVHQRLRVFDVITEQVHSIVCSNSGTSKFIKANDARMTHTGRNGSPVLISEVHVIACASEYTAPHASVLANLQSEIDLPYQQHNCMIYLHYPANALLRTGALSKGIKLLTRYNIAYMPFGYPGQTLAASRCTYGAFTVTSISSALWVCLPTVSTPTICLYVVRYLSSKHKHEVRNTQPFVAICPLRLLHITNRRVHCQYLQNRGSESGWYGDMPACMF